MESPAKRPETPKITSLKEGRYRLGRRIGKGGMASVYLAKDTVTGDRVAIKLPLRRLIADRAFVKRFRLEGESLVQLRHPHILSVLDTGFEHNRPYMVTSYLSAGTLGDRRFWRGKDVLPVVRSYFQPWLLPIADALDYIHDQGYIHRDIKPDNIFFDDQGVAVLGDFGIVKLASDAESTDSGLTRTGTMIGTPEYMAPEVAMGLTASAASDQFSLALLIWELLCGHRAFSGRTPPQIVMEQKAGRFHGIDKVRSYWGRPVVKVLTRALSFDPNERYPSCRRMAGEFSELMAASPRRPITATMTALCPHCSSPLAIEPSLVGKQLTSTKCEKKVLIQRTGDPSPTDSELLPLDEIDDDDERFLDQSGSDLDIRDTSLSIQRGQRQSCPHCGVQLPESASNGDAETRCPNCRETVTMSTGGSATTSKQSVAPVPTNRRARMAKRFTAIAAVLVLLGLIGSAGLLRWRSDAPIANLPNVPNKPESSEPEQRSGDSESLGSDSPELIAPDNQTIRTGQLWQLPINTRGLLTDQFRFRLSRSAPEGDSAAEGDSAPEGAAIDDVTGLLSWNPAYEQGDRRYQVSIELFDVQRNALVDETALVVLVVKTNHPPTIGLKNERPYEANPGELFQIGLDASDPENGQLSYKVEPPIADCEIRDDIFYWRVPESSAQRKVDFVVSVSDDETTVKRSLSVIVNVDSPIDKISARPNATTTEPSPDANAATMSEVEPEKPESPTLDDVFANNKHFRCEWQDGAWKMFDTLHVGERNESGAYSATLFRSGSISVAKSVRAMAIQVECTIEPTRSMSKRSSRMMLGFDPSLKGITLKFRKAIKNPFGITMDMRSYTLQIRRDGSLASDKQKWTPIPLAIVQEDLLRTFYRGAKIPFNEDRSKYIGELKITSASWPIFDGSLYYQQVRQGTRLLKKKPYLYSIPIAGRMNPDGSVILLRKADSAVASNQAIPRSQKPLYLRPSPDGFTTEDFELKIGRSIPPE